MQHSSGSSGSTRLLVWQQLLYVLLAACSRSVVRPAVVQLQLTVVLVRLASSQFACSALSAAKPFLCAAAGDKQAMLVGVCVGSCLWCFLACGHAQCGVLAAVPHD